MFEFPQTMPSLRRDFRNHQPEFSANGENKRAKAFISGRRVLSGEGLNDFAVPGNHEDRFQLQYSVLQKGDIGLIDYEPYQDKPPITTYSAAVKVAIADRMLTGNPERPSSIEQTDSAYVLQFDRELKVNGKLVSKFLFNKPGSNSRDQMLELFKIASQERAMFISSSGIGVIENQAVPVLKTGLIEVKFGYVRQDLDLDFVWSCLSQNLDYSAGLPTNLAAENIVVPGSPIQTTMLDYQPIVLNPADRYSEDWLNILPLNRKITNLIQIVQSDFRDNSSIFLTTGGFPPER